MPRIFVDGRAIRLIDGHRRRRASARRAVRGASGASARSAQARDAFKSYGSSIPTVSSTRASTSRSTSFFLRRAASRSAAVASRSTTTRALHGPVHAATPRDRVRPGVHVDGAALWRKDVREAQVNTAAALQSQAGLLFGRREALDVLLAHSSTSLPSQENKMEDCRLHISKSSVPRSWVTVSCWLICS